MTSRGRLGWSARPACSEVTTYPSGVSKLLRCPSLVRPRATVVGVVSGLLAGLMVCVSCSVGSGVGSSRSGNGDASAVGRGASTSLPEYKVTVAGDSISVGFGAQLREVVSAPMVVKVIGEEGTGLARPDRFDWPTRLTALARDFPPKVLVFSVGSNDAQDLRDTTGNVVTRFADTAAWDAAYSQRLGASFDAFAPPTGTRVVWVGHVCTTDAKVCANNRRVHRLAAFAATIRPWVEVVDLAALLGTGETTADRCLMEDGLHVSSACLREAAVAAKVSISPR